MKSLLSLKWFRVTWLTTTEGVSMIFSHCGGDVKSQAAQKPEMLTLLGASSRV